VGRDTSGAVGRRSKKKRKKEGGDWGADKNRRECDGESGLENSEKQAAMRTLGGRRWSWRNFKGGEDAQPWLGGTVLWKV
jgi:hypothetical protein